MELFLFKIKCFKKSAAMGFKVIQKVWVGLEFLLELKRARIHGRRMTEIIPPCTY